MTMGEAAEKVLGGATYDTALPQDWVDRVVGAFTSEGAEWSERAIVYQAILSNFVWAYDEQARVFGRPCALTGPGNDLLERINGLWGTEYPLTPNPVGDEGEGI